MALIEINKNPSPRELWWFGGLFVTFAAVVGAMLTLRGHEAAGWIVWVAGGAGGVLFLLVPPLRRPMYVGWMYAAYPIGGAGSDIVLAGADFAVLTPTGVWR